MSWPVVFMLAWTAIPVCLVVGLYLSERALTRRQRARRRRLERRLDPHARYGARYGRPYVYREDGKP